MRPPKKDALNIWRSVTKYVCEEYLDQFVNVKFKTRYGWVYVTITREPEYPDVFEEMNEIGEENVTQC